MRLPSLVACASSLCLFSGDAFADAVIEGRVELPKSHSAPVMNKRYEIVSKSGVLATDPPLAIVYLEGASSKSEARVTKQIAQKDGEKALGEAAAAQPFDLIVLDVGLGSAGDRWI